MTALDRSIRSAQRRLSVDRWFSYVSQAVTAGAGVFAVVVLVQRLFGLPLPLMWIALGLGGAALLASLIAAIVNRTDPSAAAAALDEAAGLKERISSGRYCVGAPDSFATAVVADAEQASALITVRQHIRFRTPRWLAYSGISLAVAASMFLITPGLLNTAAAEAADQKEEVVKAGVAVKHRLAAIRKAAETEPALEEFRDELSNLDSRAGGELKNPRDIRHAAIKKIDQLADAVKRKRGRDRYDRAEQTRRLLRRLKTPQSADTPAGKLAKSLAKGDFKSAREEIEKLQEQLATLKSEEDLKAAARISKELEELAKKLEKLAKQEDVVQKLQQAGIDKKDLERMLQNLSKKDLDQLRKQLEKKGFGQQAIDKIAKQLKQRQSAGATAQKLAQGLKQGAKCATPGQSGEAIAGLSMAATQLSELEALEQEMAQLDSTMASLNDARNDLDKPCPSCGGRPGGCSKCNGSGQDKGSGMGRKMGRGRGGLAPEQETGVGFKIEKGKVHTGKGAIIGKFYFEGEQVKGEVKTDIAEVVSASEREATDRISRDRVPRQYQKAVKEYFSNVKRSIKEVQAAKPGGDDKGANDKAGGKDQPVAEDRNETESPE